MNYVKKLFGAIIPILKYMFLSYLVIFVSYIFYVFFGGNDASRFLIGYGAYAVVIFNIIYIIFLFKKNRILCKKNMSVMPFFMLGIAISCFCNMIIIKINTNNNEVVQMNMLFLVLSSVIVGPLVEELIFRHILVGKLEKFNNKIFTILIASFVFAIMHSGIINIIYTFLLGVMLNTIYIKNKNLLYSLVVHSSANFIALFFTGYNIYILSISFILLVISTLIVKRDYFLK